MTGQPMTGEATKARRWPPARIARLAMRVAVVLAALWAAGVAVLWLVWPR